MCAYVMFSKYRLFVSKWRMCITYALYVPVRIRELTMKHPFTIFFSQEIKWPVKTPPSAQMMAD